MASASGVGSDVVVIGYRGTTQDVIAQGNKEAIYERGFEFTTSDTSALIDIMWSPDLIPVQTEGTISSIIPYKYESDREGTYTLLEASAMANHGNSGGPLFDMHKNVIGMLTRGDGAGEHGENIDQAVNLSIGVETINMILKEWRASQ